MTRLAGSLAIVLGVLIGASPAQAQGETAPVSFLKEMLGIRSRPAAQSEPLSLTAPPPVPGKAVATAPARTKDRPPVQRSAQSRARPKPTAAPSTPSTAAVDAAPGDNRATGDATASAVDPAGPQQQAAITPAPVAAPVPERKASVRLPAFRGGGSQAVCVRTCDGFFFPVNYEGAHSNDRYAEACQLACPAASTEVYFMPRGGELHQAATQTGHRYTALPAAFRYRKERDASCSCKAQEQTWGEVLAQADTLVKRGANDIFVTPQRSIELSRPTEPVVAEASAAPVVTKKAAAKPAKAKLAAAKARPAQEQTWKTTNRFVKIDPEPTASISIR